MPAHRLLDTLLGVRELAVSLERQHADDFDAVPETHRDSARNLLHYLAVRSHDLRTEQQELSVLGLSSLGRAEAHVLATVDAVIARLGTDTDRTHTLPDDLGRRGPTTARGERMLDDHTIEALGPPPPQHGTRIMVTLPSEAAHDPAQVRDLVESGMDVARINCAHDTPEQWLAMAANVRRAADELGRPVKVSFDLAGPKLRTGPLPDQPGVVKHRPERDDLGRVLAPARFGFGDEPGDVPLTTTLEARPGDVLGFRDSRGRRRRLDVVHADGTRFEVVSDRTVYLTGGLEVTLRRAGATVGRATIADLPPRPGVLRLRRGDLLDLVPGDDPGSPATLEHPARVSVDVPGLYEALRVGDPVLIDDGTIETIVRSVDRARIRLEVLHPERVRLRAAKGINLPMTDLVIPAITDTDRQALAVVAPVADLIATSFVGHPSDLDTLHADLDRLAAHHVGVILKIEHRRAFEALPELLLRSLRHPPSAVMVARGDLAVEVGYDRLAEVQEEILWLTEAAHTPVIWATQVLETLAKRGAPTRAEITDAALSGRAECVMLNKGPYIPETIRFLDNILTRMSRHQDKRTPLLRRLAVAGGLVGRD